MNDYLFENLETSPDGTAMIVQAASLGGSFSASQSHAVNLHPLTKGMLDVFVFGMFPSNQTACTITSSTVAAILERKGRRQSRFDTDLTMSNIVLPVIQAAVYSFIGISMERMKPGLGGLVFNCGIAYWNWLQIDDLRDRMLVQ